MNYKWKRFALISPLHAQEGVEEVRDRTYEECVTQRYVWDITTQVVNDGDNDVEG